MGAWGTGIFDNDSAADFSSDVEGCSTLEARSDLLLATMRGAVEKEPSRGLDGEYEFPYELEHALAAAAYVADAKNGWHQFTNSVYAQGHNEEKDEWYDIPINPPNLELLEAAVAAVKTILGWMERDGVDQEWQQPSRDLLNALTA